ncbi:hypothetical protein G7043_14025 [Lentzea sp. NEAU-D13]|uniref:Uncharacterized protein n=1 Tax=Lentzea alba TaxID=2714351 RepID=A0A7C9RT37_9PSEU|nr:hypothetical protein [Lentzea alba]NGY60042.1 hypothetical protein [Lentzea alba]
MSGVLLTLQFAVEDAEVLDVATPVEVDLSGSGVDGVDLPGRDVRGSAALPGVDHHSQPLM